MHLLVAVLMVIHYVLQIILGVRKVAATRK
jgi:hypothetical protein